MPNTLEFADLGEAIGNATAVLRNNAASAGLAVAVPTCPGWTMHDLLAHQGMVHRWAAAKVRDEPTRHDPEVLAEAAASDDLLQWLDDGMVDLLNALAGAPDDLEVPFFLMDAPGVTFAIFPVAAAPSRAPARAAVMSEQPSTAPPDAAVGVGLDAGAT